MIFYPNSGFGLSMELVLALDLRRNKVVHGKSGMRATYKPLDWGLSPTAEPTGFVKAVAPKFLYIADLDRIEGTGNHDRLIQECACLVDRCYVDRGTRSPADLLAGPNIENIIGTETSLADLSRYNGGYLSVDVVNGKVIPTGDSPETVLRCSPGLELRGLHHPEPRVCGDRKRDRRRHRPARSVAVCVSGPAAVWRGSCICRRSRHHKRRRL